VSGTPAKETKSLLEVEIERENKRIREMESNFKGMLDSQVKEHQQQLFEMEKLHEIQMKELEKQRSFFDEQQQSIKKQVNDRKKINELAEKIKELSDNFHTIQQQRFSNQGEFAKREEEMNNFERRVQEKRQRNIDRKEALQQRRRRIQQEVDEIKQNESQIKQDFQQEKGQIMEEIDRQEMDNLKELKVIKDRVIEQEVESRRVAADTEKTSAQILSQQNQHDTKLGELSLDIKQLQEQRVKFTKDSTQTEKGLRVKLSSVQDQLKTLQRDERKFAVLKEEFEGEHNKVISLNEDLTQELNKYCFQKEQFDSEVQEIYEKVELDKLESEKIGFFKINKERLHEELKRQKADQDTQRAQLRDDRMKLEVFKGELSTKQKTIEALRYNYIKQNQEVETYKS